VSAPEIRRFDRFDLRLEQQPWAFADHNRAAIDARFAAKQLANPALWNGRVLLAHRYEVSEGTCRGGLLETDFASFNAWRDWGRPPAAIVNCFAVPVVRSADGALLMGVMGPHTANAGQIYFPCGTPDPGDVRDGLLDMEHNARHELHDETGLIFEEMTPDPAWLSVRVESWAMAVKLLQAPEPAEVLRARVLRHLAAQTKPELSDIRMVRGPSDLDPMMPSFVSVFLRHIWT
jgi:hypothetical protein